MKGDAQNGVCRGTDLLTLKNTVSIDSTTVGADRAVSIILPLRVAIICLGHRERNTFQHFGVCEHLTYVT